jgi:ubiquinone/menaquinone biosynthesis C-methylase UbiE
VFTADVFARHRERPIVLLDYSLAMLRRARRRLERAAGRVPDNLILLQADIFDLPFPDSVFATVSAPFVIHIFEDVGAVIGGLRRVLSGGGGLFITSLVSRPGSHFGNWYLQRLHKAGEVAAPRDPAQLLKLIETAGCTGLDCHAVGHVAYLSNAGSGKGAARASKSC